ncbi:hypothetical protein B0H14DRAFT_3896881 [Mycena olivaceomarginata]|nr:hypothetical protein B0H14DRAFT_3896881 [Mycena olivaceomarginata]
MARDGSSKPSKKKPKDQRRNLRLWAEGNREKVLLPYLPDYAAAMGRGSVQERKLLRKICREYHVRIPWTVADHEEPVLQPWDPKAPIPLEVLSEEQEVLKIARVDELNSRIRRWYRYRLRRTHKYRRTTGLDPAKDPFARLLGKLSGLTAPPKARQAYQQFMHESYKEKCEAIVNNKLAEFLSKNPGATKSRKVAFSARVSKEIFMALSAVEREQIANRAKTEADTAKATYKAALQQAPATTPQARQQALDRLTDFMAPILAEIFNTTGCHATLIVGGPIPEYGGEISTRHISFGRNLTATADHWGQWDEARFSKQVSSFFVEYLQTAYTATDCANAALPGTQGGNTTEPHTSTKAVYSRTSGTTGAVGSGEHSDSDSSESESSDSDSDSETLSDSDLGSGNKRRKKQRVASAITITQSSLPPLALSTQSQLPPTTSSQSASAPLEPTIPNDGLWNFSGDLVGWQASSFPPLSSDSSTPPGSLVTQGSAVPIFPTTTTAASSSPSSFEAPSGMFHAFNPIPATQRMSAPSFTSFTPQNPIPGGLSELLASDFDSIDFGVFPPTISTASIPDAPGSPVSVSVSQTHQLVTPNVLPTAIGAPNLTCITSSVDAPTNALTAESTVTNTPPSGGTTCTTPEASSPKRQRRQSRRSAGDTTPATTTTHREPRSWKSRAADGTECPPNAADWFVTAHKRLTGVKLGSHYDAVVAAWVRIEKASRFEEGDDRLPATNRPGPVSTWMRSKKATPKIPNIEAFVVAWQGWWDSLQPSWRTKQGDGKWKLGGQYGGKGADWGSLYTWGPHGVVSIVASLYMWGRMTQEDKSLYPAWEAAVCDVGWILEGMAIYYERFKW